MSSVKEIMTAEVFTINKSAPLSQAIDLMLKHQISGLPVVDSEQNLVGIITEKDLLQLYNKTQEVEGMVVEDYMTKPVITFYEDETFEEICKCLETTDFRRVPVIDSAGKVVGIISRPDITRRILQKIRKNPVAQD
ncbi:MAG: CBS domain-containing protein [Phycisphaerae bacterium]